MRPKALLLCAGTGTRLRPLTDVLPKCLMPINGRPLLEHWLELLVASGITDIMVNLHHHAPLVEGYISKSRFKDFVRTTYETELLGTAGTFLKNRDFFQSSTALLAHADNLSLFDPNDFILAHSKRPEGAEITMMTFETDSPATCGIVELDARGVVRAFHEKVSNPPGNLANAAVYICEPSVLRFLESLGREQIDFSTDVIPRFLGRMGTYHNSVYHRDIGNPESWFRAQVEFSLLREIRVPRSDDAWRKLLTADQAELYARFLEALKKV